MGLIGKDNRRTQANILSARQRTEKGITKVKRAWANALRPKKSKGRG